MEIDDGLGAKLARLALCDFEGLRERAVAGKHDIYKLAVAEVLGIYIGDVLDEERMVAKTIFFGFSYGMRFDHTRSRRLPS